MTFIFFDTETTGLIPAWDQIVQFAAIVTDDDFNVLEEVDLRCRLRPHVIPSPMAMWVTRVGPKAIQSAPLSCYEMTGQIREFIKRWTPAVLIGFNSVSFDENMLRQLFFQHLHPTYQTNTNGNSRMDILRLAHAVAEHQPDAIVVPLNEKGRPSFRLEHLVQANGLKLDQAHDALHDARATLALAKFLKDRAPQVWDDLLACRSRHTTEALLANHSLFLYTDRQFKKPTILAGVITSNPKNPAAVAVFDLEYDPYVFLDADVEAVRRLLKASPRPIRVMRTNALPIVSPHRGRTVGVDLDTAQARLDSIRQHPRFAGIVADAMTIADDEFEPSPHIEQSIYSGFPIRRDEKAMEDFHRAAWPDRYKILNRFYDRKYAELAERIIHAEFPEGLPEERRTALGAWLTDRHATAHDVPWWTIAKAQNELEAIKSEAASEQDFALLAEIEAYLAQARQL